MVTSSPAGIDCGLNCSTALPSGTQVTLTASPASSLDRFSGWSGDVTSSANPLQVSLTADLTLQANFERTTFLDVPTDYSETLGGINYLLYPYIEALYEAGFTNGCALPPNAAFCPTQILNRAMVAKFLLNVNHGANYSTPALPASPYFLDSWTDPSGIDGSWAQPWVEQLYSEGLTNGCLLEPPYYCPWENLPRIQAAKFGLMLKYGVDYTPPPSDGVTLADLVNPVSGEFCRETGEPGDICWGSPWAEQAFHDGLIPGCGFDDAANLPRICPQDAMDRAWTAYMIVQARGLPLP